MFHLNTELLIDYWRARRGERRIPARSDIDPAAFAALLPQAFILVRDPDGVFRFRLAGETINDLHGRGLRASRWTCSGAPIIAVTSPAFSTRPCAPPSRW